jgi:acyl-CoA thioester hydrolase
MLEVTILPQFSDTDALGHANYQASVRWFEVGRMPIYKLFAPEFTRIVRQRHGIFLVMVHFEIDYHNETLLDYEITVRTWLTKIGRSSFHVEQELLQQGVRCSTGRVVLVCYDLATRKSVPIPDEVRKQLERWMGNNEQ